MSSNNTKKNKIVKNIINDESFTNALFNSLGDIEQKSKDLSIKNICVKENILSIKFKEKKIEKINLTIWNKKEELKLLKELFSLKEEKKMNIKDIMDSYIDFLISSNDILDNKLNTIFQKEKNINQKQKYINKIVSYKNENDYDYIYENINKPIDITKFIIGHKATINNNINSRRITENGGIKYSEKKGNENNDIHFCDNRNITNSNKNIFQSKKNKISSSSSYEKISNGIKMEEIQNSFIYRDSSKKTSNTKYENNSNIKALKTDDNYKKYEKFLSPKNMINKDNKCIINKLPLEKQDKKNENNLDKLNDDEYIINSSNVNFRNANKFINNFAKTDINDFNNYNLEPNKKLKAAREIFQRLLNKLKNKNELFFSNTNRNNNNLKFFFLNVLDTKYLLRKVLSVIFKCAEIYIPNNKRTITETMHDSEFLSKLNDYEDSEDNYEDSIERMNYIKIFERGLEEIKKVTKETKQLQDKISKFAYKVNAIG